MPDLKVTTVDAFRAQNTRIVALPTGPVFKLRMVDPLLVFDDEDGMANPLLAQVAGLIRPGGDAAPALKPDAIPTLRKRLNALLVKALVEPPLVQQGHADGLDVDEIGLEHKLAVFTELLGGVAAVTAANNFPE